MFSAPAECSVVYLVMIGDVLIHTDADLQLSNCLHSVAYFKLLSL